MTKGKGIDKPPFIVRQMIDAKWKGACGRRIVRGWNEVGMNLRAFDLVWNAEGRACIELKQGSNFTFIPLDEVKKAFEAGPE